MPWSLGRISGTACAPKNCTEQKRAAQKPHSSPASSYWKTFSSTRRPLLEGAKSLLANTSHEQFFPSSSNSPLCAHPSFCPPPKPLILFHKEIKSQEISLILMEITSCPISFKLNQSFAGFNVYISHLGVLLKGRVQVNGA